MVHIDTVGKIHKLLTPVCASKCFCYYNKSREEWECTPGHQQQDGRAFLDMFASHHFFYQSKEISGHLSRHTHSYELRKPVMNLLIEK